MLAKIVKVEEIALDDDEAKQLSDAINEVSKHYKMSIIPPKTQAWIQLAIAASTVYAPRVFSHMRKPGGAKPAQAKQPQIITPKKPAPASPAPAPVIDASDLLGVKLE